MSLIPEPEVVAHGALPGVNDLLEFANAIVVRYSSEEHQLVLYGSLARGDASVRSDIDLCVLPPTQDYPKWMYHYPYDTQRAIEGEIKDRGWLTGLTLLSFVSRREDVKRLDRFSRETSDPDEAMFSITTYDHFGFLSRDRSLPEIRRLQYRQIQRDVQQHSRTGKNERFRDLIRYVAKSLEDANFYFGRRRPEYLGRPIFLEKAGWLENAVYHCLRKLAGISKTFKGPDAKAALIETLNSQVPFFAELLQHFGIVRQFGLDVEEVLGRCLGQPKMVGEYEAFLNMRLVPMVEAALTLFELLDREIQEKTLLETIATYDRQAPKTVLLEERFDKFEWLIRMLQKEGVPVCLAVHWWCVGEQVLVCSPSRAFVEYQGKTVQCWQQPWFNNKELDKRLITAEGRVEIDFSQSPPMMQSVCVRPMKPERINYQQAALLAEKAVIAKLREVLPAEIIFHPQS